MYTFDNLMKDANALDTMMNQLIDLGTKFDTLEDNQCREAYSKLNDARDALIVLHMLRKGKAA